MDKKTLKDMECQAKAGIPYATKEEMEAMGYVWNPKTEAWRKKGKNENKGKKTRISHAS